MIRTSVRVVLSASHLDMATGRLHGHTYVAWITFDGEPLVDARLRRAAAEEAMASLDHQVLPPELAAGERLAAAIGQLNEGCVHVRLEREPEGIITEWWAE